MQRSYDAVDSIAGAHRLLSERAISPSELVEEHARRIVEREPTIKAWAHLGLEAAREQARALDAKLGAMTTLPPLFGIPFGAKDIFHTRQLPTEAGSRVLEGFQPDANASVIDKLEEQGAILLGKTTTTEFAHMGGPPKTVNPWRHTHTPGGSSSGSAASVASSMAMFALGTQTAGSLSRPAAYNGLTVLKGSFGRVSKAGVIPGSWTLDHIGGLTHSVEDSVMLYNAISGPDPADEYTWSLPYQALAVRTRRNYTVGVVDHPYFASVSEDVQAGVENALRVFEEAGIRVVRVRLPEGFEALAAAHAVVMQSEMSAYHADWHAQVPDLYTPEVRAYLADGMGLKATDYLRAQRIRAQYRVSFAEVFGDVDALVTPAAPTAAPHGLLSTGSPVFNLPFTNLGVPTLVMPVGFDSTGALPVGMQLVAADAQEQALVDIGLLYQSETDWHQRRPAL
jgi:aspartyl-tRNA(Asn)/glutamyl-tRNA(Gln) amidotransferase subunit A